MFDTTATATEMRRAARDGRAVHPYLCCSHEQIRNTICYLRLCRQARANGYRGACIYDPSWLVHMAINRRAGWPDDPSTSRGSCMPVNGKYPRRAEGDYYRHLCLTARRINMRERVYLSELGEHRWLARRLPNRFATSWDD